MTFRETRGERREGRREERDAVEDEQGANDLESQVELVVNPATPISDKEKSRISQLAESPSMHSTSTRSINHSESPSSLMASTSTSSSDPERLDDLQSRIHALEAQLATLKLEASSISSTSTHPRKEETGLPLELEEYVGRTTLLPPPSLSTLTDRDQLRSPLLSRLAMVAR